jgi:hypothetical protein
LVSDFGFRIYGFGDFQLGRECGAVKYIIVAKRPFECAFARGRPIFSDGSLHTRPRWDNRYGGRGHALESRQFQPAARGQSGSLDACMAVRSPTPTCGSLCSMPRRAWCIDRSDGFRPRFQGPEFERAFAEDTGPGDGGWGLPSESECPVEVATDEAERPGTSAQGVARASGPEPEVAGHHRSRVPRSAQSAWVTRAPNQRLKESRGKRGEWLRSIRPKRAAGTTLLNLAVAMEELWAAQSLQCPPGRAHHSDGPRRECVGLLSDVDRRSLLIRLELC